MSMDTENRACNICKRKFVLQSISDAHSGGGIEFLLPPPKGGDVRDWRAVEICPGCGIDLSLETTHKIKE